MEQREKITPLQHAPAPLQHAPAQHCSMPLHSTGMLFVNCTFVVSIRHTHIYDYLAISTMSMNLQIEFQNTVPKIERYVPYQCLHSIIQNTVYTLYCMQRRDKTYAYIQNFLTIDQVRQPVIL